MNWFKNIFNSKTIETPGQAPQEAKAHFMNAGIFKQMLTTQGFKSNWDYETFATQGYKMNPNVHAAIDIIVKLILQYRLKVVKNAGTDEEEEVQNELSDLLENPNEYSSQKEFLTEFFSQYLLSGNGVLMDTFTGTAEENIKAADRPKPSQIMVIPASNFQVETAEMVFGCIPIEYKSRLVEEFSWLPSESMHMRTFNPFDKALGLAPIWGCFLSVQYSNEVKKWNINAIKNGLNPSGIYTTPGNLNDMQFGRTKAQLKEDTGADHAREPIVLEGGLGFTPTGMNPDDMDFLAGQNEMRREIAAVYNIGSQLIGDTESQTFANYEMAIKDASANTARPTLESFVFELNRWLTPRFGDDIKIIIDDSDVSILQEDVNEKWARVDASIELDLDEKRIAKGYESRSELKGIYILNNSMTLEQTMNPPEVASVAIMPNDEEEEKSQVDFSLDDVAYKHLIKMDIEKPECERLAIEAKAINDKRQHSINQSKDVVAEFFNDEMKLINKKMDNSFTPEDLNNAILAAIEEHKKSWLGVYNEIYKEIAPQFVASLFKGFKSLHEKLEYKGLNFDSILPLETKDNDVFSIRESFKVDYDSFVDQYYSQIMIGSLIESMTDETKTLVSSQIIAGTKKGETMIELMDRVQGLYGGLNEWRAERIARTETIRATNFAQVEGVKAIDPDMKKIWIPTRDNRTRPTGKGVFNHRSAGSDNGRIKLTDDFVVSGQNLHFPGDSSAGASAGNTINCRCVVGFLS